VTSRVEGDLSPPKDEGPVRPPAGATDAARLRYCEEALELGIAEQRRMRTVQESVAKDVDAIATDVSTLACDVDEAKGVLARVDSMISTLVARDLARDRETAPPTMEVLQEIRAKHDKLARQVERAEAVRRAQAAKIAGLEVGVADLKGDVRETTKRAAVTAEHAIEVLAHERDSAHELLEKARERVEEKSEKKAEANAHVIAAREGRRFEIARAIGVPVLLIALGFLAGKLQACTGVVPIHLPAPAAAPPH
jgi:chromosome segregation ATPase